MTPIWLCIAFFTYVIGYFVGIRTEKKVAAMLQDGVGEADEYKVGGTLSGDGEDPPPEF